MLELNFYNLPIKMPEIQLYNPLTKKMWFFYFIELLSVIGFTIKEGNSNLIWLTVVTSFIGIVPKYLAQRKKLSYKVTNIITQACLILSSLLWAYIIMYSLNSAPMVYSIILVARIVSTIIAFKDIRDHIIIVVPLLLAFALLKPAGCIPPLAF